MHQLFTIHILFYPFTNPQRIGTIIDNGVPHFFENGLRMFWREHTMSSSPDLNQAHRPRQALLAPIYGGLSHPDPFWPPMQRHWGLGRSGPVLFIYLYFYFEIVLQDPLRRPALPEPSPSSSWNLFADLTLSFTSLPQVPERPTV